MACYCPNGRQHLVLHGSYHLNLNSSPMFSTSSFVDPVASWSGSTRQSLDCEGKEGTMTTRKPSILIAEDDDQIRILLSTILEQSGYSVRIAHDGVAALEELRIEIPDILLSDLHMPRMTGFELLPIVRQEFPETRVVAMSSAFPENEVPAGVAADAFYPKASNVAGLLEIIETMACLDASRACSPSQEYALPL